MKRSNKYPGHQIVERLFVVTLKTPQIHDWKLHLFNYFQIGSDILILISFIFIIQLHLQITMV